jgi:hypothetical protein
MDRGAGATVREMRKVNSPAIIAWAALSAPRLTTHSDVLQVNPYRYHDKFIRYFHFDKVHPSVKWGRKAKGLRREDSRVAEGKTSSASPAFIVLHGIFPGKIGLPGLKMKAQRKVKEKQHENTHGADFPRSTGQHRPQDGLLA